MSFLPYFSVSTIPYAGIWSPGVDLGVALFTVLALVFANRKPHFRNDAFIVAGGALAIVVASAL
jgi:hypothetical protein